MKKLGIILVGILLTNISLFVNHLDLLNGAEAYEQKDFKKAAKLYLI